MVWEVLIWAIILLVVAVILIYSFQKLFGKQAVGISGEIDALNKDSDSDGVKDAIDRCPGTTPQGTKVDVRGCSPEQIAAQEKNPA